MRRVFRSRWTLATPTLAALALLAPSVLHAQTPSAQSAQTIDGIIAKNIAAKGGAEKWKSLESMKLTGTFTSQGMEMPVTIVAKRPNLMRQEMTVNGQQIVQAFDGTTAWMINPMMGATSPQEITGQQADMVEDQADFDGVLMDYKAKGYQVELVPPESSDDKRFNHLRVTKKNGQVQDFYLDAETGLDARSTTTFEENGREATVTSELSDYREVNGIMVPFSMKQSLNGQVIGQLTVKNVEFNVPVDAAQFAPPK